MNRIAEIVGAAHLWGYVVLVEFADGRRSVVDLGKVMRGPAFDQIKSDGSFSQFVVDPDERTLVWPNGADIDPETIWSASSLTSEDDEPRDPKPHPPRGKIIHKFGGFARQTFPREGHSTGLFPHTGESTIPSHRTGPFGLSGHVGLWQKNLNPHFGPVDMPAVSHTWELPLELDPVEVGMSAVFIRYSAPPRIPDNVADLLAAADRGRPGSVSS